MSKSFKCQSRRRRRTARCFASHARSCKRLYASSKLPSEIDFLIQKCSKTIQNTEDHGRSRKSSMRKFLNSSFPALGVASASVASWHPDAATSGRAVGATPSRDPDPDGPCPCDGENIVKHGETDVVCEISVERIPDVVCPCLDADVTLTEARS